MSFEAVGLGNAIMDALVRIEDDSLIASLGLTRGQMHPVDHARWVSVYETRKVYGLLDSGLTAEEVGAMLIEADSAEGAVNRLATRVLRMMTTLRAKPDNLTIVAIKAIGR